MGHFSSGGDLTHRTFGASVCITVTITSIDIATPPPASTGLTTSLNRFKQKTLHPSIMFRATSARMATFQNKKFRSSADTNQLGMKYRALMNRHPFLMFGLPFLGVIISGSFVLTPATAVRYEKHDRKVRQMTKEEELNVRRSPRKVDMREEYYVSAANSTSDDGH